MTKIKFWNNSRTSYRIFHTIFDKVFPLMINSVLNIAAHENKLQKHTQRRS